MNCCGQLHGCTAPQMIKPTQIILVVPETQAAPEPCFLGMTSTLEPKSSSPRSASNIYIVPYIQLEKIAILMFSFGIHLQFILEGKAPNDGNWGNYKNQGEQFICNVIQQGSNNVKKTNAGALWWDPFNNLQYTTSALFLTASYSDSLSAAKDSLNCPAGSISPDDLISFARSQACVDTLV